VEAAQASYVRPPATNSTFAAAPTLPVQSITYGLGEGKQPAPEYPSRAMREGQEGTVQILFAVAPDGHVLTAEISKASPWRLLNEAAVRAVRDRWRFRAGTARRYEVAIRFELSK
jgi:protein TonB